MRVGEWGSLLLVAGKAGERDGPSSSMAVARLLNQPDIVRETVAKRIAALAAKGERDAHALCDQALVAEGFLR